MFYTVKLPNETIDNILSIVQNNNLKNTLERTCTVDGFQTDNILNLFSDDLLKKILPIDDMYKYLFHVHYIEYMAGGLQLEHDHKYTEQYSFILYLNDSDGDTIFKDPVNKIISPEKGKLIVFPSEVRHYALQSYKNKKVLVGAINEKL